jgi:hypothetical protein
MKIIGLIGEPAAGKSTVMREVIGSLGEGTVRKEGLVCYTEFLEDKVMVAGIYDEAVFSGTDRLSKGCGPKYREWVAAKVADPQYSEWVFYWEGERISNSKFFDFFFKDCPEVTVYFVQADENTLNERNANRSNQNPTWRKGMATRMRNLRENYPVQIVEQGFSLVRGND